MQSRVIRSEYLLLRDGENVEVCREKERRQGFVEYENAVSIGRFRYLHFATYARNAVSNYLRNYFSSTRNDTKPHSERKREKGIRTKKKGNGNDCFSRERRVGISMAVCVCVQFTYIARLFNVARCSGFNEKCEMCSRTTRRMRRGRTRHVAYRDQR